MIIFSLRRGNYPHIRLWRVELATKESEVNKNVPNSFFGDAKHAWATLSSAAHFGRDYDFAHVFGLDRQKSFTSDIGIAEHLRLPPHLSRREHPLKLAIIAHTVQVRTRKEVHRSATSVDVHYDIRKRE